jgi:2-polyprenyl-6-methoxyphenol hydroxylase-like FAD-dependent oxidoreductase
VRNADGSVQYMTGDVVIGADGARSKFAELVGAPIIDRGQHASGTLYRYYDGTSLKGYHWHFVPGMTAGAIPTTGGQICVFVGVAADRFAQLVHSGVEEAFQRCLQQCAPTPISLS